MIPAAPATTKLQHARLERVIYQRTPLGELIGELAGSLAPWRVADYVGSHQIDRSRFGAQDLIGATAVLFFEDAGAHLESFPGEPHGRPYNLAVFATFLVVEIRPLTPEVEFLVLAPPLTETGPYAGLVGSQNADALRAHLREPEGLRAALAAIDALLVQLAAPPKARRRGLLSRLLRRP
jgi:hypothetical protein